MIDEAYLEKARRAAGGVGSWWIDEVAYPLLNQRDDLLAALERARQHLVMNEWVDDEGARRRFAAVKETEAAIARAEKELRG